MIRKRNSNEMQYVHEKKIENDINRQIVFCSATVTKQIEKLSSDYWIPGDKNFINLIEKNTHMNLANLDHEFIKLSEKDKYGPLDKILREFKAFQKEAKTSAMLFVNSIQSARSAEHTLSALGFKVSSLHGDIPPLMRKQYFEDFKNRETEILVSTDLGSRGLDFPFVSHIFNLDFPKTVSDYMHRAGRAGRAGRPGYVKSFYRSYDMPIIEEMRKSHEESTPLKIGSSAFNLRKEHEKPIRSKALPVSNPAKRKTLGDPLQAKSDLVIKSYTAPRSESPKPGGRVLKFKNKSRDANERERRSPVKERQMKQKIQRNFERYGKRQGVRSASPHK